MAGSPIIFSGRRAKLLTADAILNSDGSINDNNGIVNLIKNGHAEVNTTGWSTYADAAGTRPVDGTGGSPTVTWTRSTTSPLSGQAHFLFTKDASNRQGEGASYAFNVPTDLKAKVVQIELDYMVMSGTFVAGSSTADSDLIWYVYDVTNSALIEPSSIKLLSNSSTLTDKFIANFQTSATGTSYRLICHVASTSASAYTLAFKNISVKPCQYVYGTPITDWVAYTPTFGPGFGTVSSSAFFSRRVGDSLEVYGKWANGTVASNVASITVGYGGGNANVTIDTSKVAPLTIIGSLQTSLTSTTFFTPYPIAPASNATTISFTYQSSTVGYGTGAALGNQISATGSENSLHFTVPIVGWSSSVQVSDGYDGRLIAAQAFRQTTGQSLSGSSDIKIQWNGKTKDTTSSFDNVTNYRFTVPSSGTYVHTGQISLGTGSGVASIGLHLYKNGGPLSTVGYTISSTTNNCSIPISIEVDANANDYFELYINPNGASITILSNASIYSGSQWNISKKQSPTTISATEVVAASYQMATAQTLTSAATIKFDTKIIDTHNAYNTTTGVFTAPVSGLYEVSAQLFSVTATAEWTPQIRKQSSAVARTSPSPVFNTGTTINNNQSMARFSGYLVELTAGQTLDIYNSSAIGTGTIYNSAIDNWLTIKRIK